MRDSTTPMHARPTITASPTMCGTSARECASILMPTKTSNTPTALRGAGTVGTKNQLRCASVARIFDVTTMNVVVVTDMSATESRANVVSTSTSTITDTAVIVRA